MGAEYLHHIEVTATLFVDNDEISLVIGGDLMITLASHLEWVLHEGHGWTCVIYVSIFSCGLLYGWFQAGLWELVICLPFFSDFSNWSPLLCLEGCVCKCVQAYECSCTFMCTRSHYFWLWRKRPHSCYGLFELLTVCVYRWKCCSMIIRRFSFLLDLFKFKWLQFNLLVGYEIQFISYAKFIHFLCFIEYLRVFMNHMILVSKWKTVHLCRFFSLRLVTWNNIPSITIGVEGQRYI